MKPPDWAGGFWKRKKTTPATKKISSDNKKAAQKAAGRDKTRLPTPWPWGWDSSSPSERLNWNPALTVAFCTLIILTSSAFNTVKMNPEMWETFVTTFTSTQTCFIFSFVSPSKVQTLSWCKSREEHKEEVLKQLFKNYLARTRCFALHHFHCKVFQSQQNFRSRKVHFCMKKRR